MIGWLQATLALVATAIGVYGSLTKYASDTSAMYFVLTAAGVIVFFDKLPKIKDSLRPIYFGLGGVFVLGALAIGWFNGGLVRLAEVVSCDLRLPFCQSARLQRIGSDFAPLKFIGFNHALTESEVERAKEFCLRYDLGEAIAFALTTEGDQPVNVRYRVAALTPDWQITANEPMSDAPDIDLGSMNADDRITRSPIRLPGGSTEGVLVTVCVKRSATGLFDAPDFAPSRILNVVDIEVTPGT